MSIGAEPHVNTCYKHFFYFVSEFSLVNEKEFEPLKEMTRRICTDRALTAAEHQLNAAACAAASASAAAASNQ
jgi:hypothetical protein